jgi:hypothetical protein
MFCSPGTVREGTSAISDSPLHSQSSPQARVGRQPILGVVRGRGAVPAAELPLGKNPALLPVVAGDGDAHQLALERQRINARQVHHRFQECMGDRAVAVNEGPAQGVPAPRMAGGAFAAEVVRQPAAALAANSPGMNYIALSCHIKSRTPMPCLRKCNAGMWIPQEYASAARGGGSGDRKF